jgi:DNA repair photolyase
MRQTALFPDTKLDPRALPVLGDQKDIRYLGVAARSVLNRPEATGMGYWSINPYIGCAFGCGYCYARFAHRYAMDRRDAPAEGLPPWLAFERRVLVKENAPALVRRALRTGSARHLGLVRGEAVVIGTATDPYQPAERRYRVTRGILEALAEHPGLHVVIISKSPLVTRDIDVLRRIARHGRVTVHVSLITIDRDLARRIEPRAPTPEARLRGVARLRAAGIDVGVNVMPVLPGLTDAPEALDALVRRVAEAGATHAGACALRLRSDARNRWLPLVAREFPHLAARYRIAYARGHEVHDRYREGLAKVFARLCARHGLRARTYDEDDDGPEGAIASLQLSLAL